MNGIPIRIEQQTQPDSDPRVRLAGYLQAGHGMEVEQVGASARTLIYNVTGKGIVICFRTAAPMSVTTPQPLLEPPHVERMRLSESLMELRALVLEALKYHEDSSHGGQPCRDERLNIIAFFCHSLGIKPDQMPAVADRLADYEEEHGHRMDENVRSASEVSDG